MKKISIIIPLYRGKCYVPKLVRMIEDNWRFANEVEPICIEAVLVNDFPAETINKMEQWTENITWTVVVNQQNGGIHFSRTQGFLHSKGDYILFLDQDDEISPIYIREQLKALGDYDAVVCNGKNRGNLIYKNSEELDKAIDVDEYRKGINRIVSPGQVLLKRESIPKEWVEKILKKNGADDYFLWMLMFWQRSRIMVQDKALYLHLITSENSSNNTAEMDDSVFEMVESLTELGCLRQKDGIRIKESRISSDDEVSLESYKKEKKYRQILDLWLSLRERNISVDKFLKKKGLRRIAIYGGGILGKHLYYELRESSIDVECFLDKKIRTDIMGLKSIVPGEPIGYVDGIIVTPFMEYTQVYNELKKYYMCDFSSIENVLLNADCELVEK